MQIHALSWREWYYNREVCMLLGREVPNWVHPFVESLSDAVVGTLEEAASAFLDLDEVRDLNYVRLAMEHYKTSQFPHDHPMQDLIASSNHLQDKFYESIQQ